MTVATSLGERAPLLSRYGRERVVVATMMRVLGGLLAAASETDEQVAREVAELPDGLVFGMSILGGGPAVRLAKRDEKLVLVDPATRAELEIVFKHIHHAYLVLSFQEGTARAFANDRMVTHGDLALAMKMVRCLNRVQTVALPRLIGERVLKTYPDVALGDKLRVGARVYRRTLALALGRK